MKQTEATNQIPKIKRQWMGWFLAVGAWILHLSLSYGLVEWYCINRSAMEQENVSLLLNLLTLACLALALSGAWLAWRSAGKVKRIARSEEEKAKKKAQEQSLQEQPDPQIQRSRFMAVSGIAISLSFTTLIAVQGIPNLMVQPCL